MHAQRKQSLINAGYEAKSKKIKCGCRAKVKSEAGYVSKNTLVASILGHHGTNFIYFGPLDNGTWAHHTKWAQHHETSGFRKPETRREKGYPSDCLFWEILRFFPRKWFSQWPNTFILIKKIFFRTISIELWFNPKEWSWEQFRRSQWDYRKIIGFTHARSHVFLKFLFQNSLLQAVRWRGG